MVYSFRLILAIRTAWALAEDATHVHDTARIDPISESRTVDCDHFCPLAQDTLTNVLPLTMRWCDIKSQHITDMYNYPSEQTTTVDYWGARDWCTQQAPEQTIISVHSDDENKCVFALCDNCWVGINDYDTIGLYLNSDGTPYNYPVDGADNYPWSNGQPNNLPS